MAYIETQAWLDTDLAKQLHQKDLVSLWWQQLDLVPGDAVGMLLGAW